MAAAVRHLPFGLARIVPPNLLGFAVINGFTFACDLALLTALHGGLRWPVAVSITLSYAIASGLSYLLNRTFNFHSHAAIGRQFATYVAVIAVNYLAWILGVGAGLAALGVSYQLARIIAGLCEAVYMYAAMRWLVFRDTRASPGPEASPGPRRLLADFLAHTAETLPVSRGIPRRPARHVRDELVHQPCQRFGLAARAAHAPSAPSVPPVLRSAAVPAGSASPRRPAHHGRGHGARLRPDTGSGSLRAA